MLTRRTIVEVSIDGVNVTADLDHETTSISYNDQSGENDKDFIDELSLTVQNRSKKWLSEWEPKKGDIISAKFLHETGTLDCGEFIIDTVSFSGYPQTLQIKALAVPMNVAFSDVERSQTWNQATIEEIANSIGSKNGIKIEYKASYNPVLEFVSQTKETDKNFIYTFCKKYGLTAKMYSTKIIIYDMAELEKRIGEFVIQEGAGTLLNYSCETTMANTAYTDCTVLYTTKEGNTLEYTHSIPGETKKEYRHNTRLHSLAEAKRVAEALLREKNLAETTFSCSITGDTTMVAGRTGQVRGFGNFDGKYIIDSATHEKQKGYRVSLTMHKIM